MGTKEGMTVQAKESLKGCDCMIGAKRLLEEVSDADCVCHAEILESMEQQFLYMRELSEVGMYLGQMDVRTGRTSMQMYLENLGAEIEETRQEITAKKRIGNWLGVMSGLFLEIVLF